jgi:hypothetical protein
MRMMAQQTFGGDIIISVDLIRSRLNVESHELAIVPRPKLGTDITLIDGLSPLGNTRSGEEETAGDAPCNRLPVTAASSCLPAPWSRGGLHQAAALLLHRHMPAGPEPLLKAIAPDRADRVVGVEGRFPWYGLADRWARERMPLVLGQALSRNAIHGGNATHDRCDAQHMAVLRRGGCSHQPPSPPRRGAPPVTCSGAGSSSGGSVRRCAPIATRRRGRTTCWRWKRTSPTRQTARVSPIGSGCPRVARPSCGPPGPSPASAPA